MKKKPVAVTVPLVIRMPKKVVAEIDRQAANNGRSRSGEARVRLLQSLKSSEVTA